MRQLKLSLLLIILLVVKNISAQPYFPFSLTKTTYFDSRLNIWALVPNDSQVTQWPKTYWFKTAVLPTNYVKPDPYVCAANIKGSIIGQKVLNYGDSVFEFYNSFNLPIKLYTQTTAGQSWQAYADSNAIVTFTHSRDSLLVNDKLKIITINVQYLNSIYGNESYDPILLSEKNGLYVLPELYSFPFSHYISSYLSPRKLTQRTDNVHNITWDSVYNYQIGDEIHELSFRYDIKLSANTKIIYEIIDRVQPNPDSVVYKSIRYQNHEYFAVDSTNTTFKIDTFYLRYKRIKNLDEEPSIKLDDRNSYSLISDEHGIGKTITIPTSPRFQDSCIFISFETADYQFTETYITGLGGPYGEYRFNYGFTGRGTKLVYYKKGNKTWGIPFSKTVGVNNISNQIKASVFPNPATETLTIQLQQPTRAQITVYDYTGKLVDTFAISEASNHLNISTLKPGIYLYVIKSTNTSTSGKFIKQ